jgi:hypothetical protein
MLTAGLKLKGGDSTSREMILDILTVLFFVSAFVLVSMMTLERRRDVLHGPYVTKSEMARGDVCDRRPESEAAREQPDESSFSDVADELSHIVREIERETDSREGKAKGK